MSINKTIFFLLQFMVEDFASVSYLLGSVYRSSIAMFVSECSVAEVK